MVSTCKSLLGYAAANPTSTAPAGPQGGIHSPSTMQGGFYVLYDEAAETAEKEAEEDEEARRRKSTFAGGSSKFGGWR